MLAVQDRVAVQSALPQALIPVQKGAVQDVCRIEKHQVTHGGNRTSRTAETIAQIQSDAVMWDDPLILSRDKAADS